MGFIDSIPIISQMKSVVQLMAGDVEGARRTQETFHDTALGVSQVTSLVHFIAGDKQKAKAVQEKFLKSLDQTTDGLPIVGHIKGGIYYATGDKKRGDQLMKDATGSLVSEAAGAAGFAVGGPAGAAAASIAASHAYDGLITGIDTAIHGTIDGSPRYYGSLASYDRIGKDEVDAGQVFDSVAMLAMEAAPGVTGAKIGKRPPGTVATGIKGSIRCRREVEYHLTSDEAQFVTTHRKLPGTASEVLKANWQHLSAPEMVSNLVSLFIILRLILWNDKNGRTYTKELCSLTTDYEYLEICQDSLIATLRRMDDHFTRQEKGFEYVISPTLVMTGIADNSTLSMIQSTASLYGILESMARGDAKGVIWLTELCIYEDPKTYRICKEEVLQKFKKLGNEAYNLGVARKHRVKRSVCRDRRVPQLQAWTLRSGRTPFQFSINVGNHTKVQKLNKVKNLKPGARYESNHVPAYSSYPDSPPKGSLPAHSLPYKVHQTAMTKVGTSKGSHVAMTLRDYEKKLISKNKTSEAIKLDFTASYGRANVKLNTKGKTTSFLPALVKYKNDLKALVTVHRKQRRISRQHERNLHRFLEIEAKAWHANKDWETWIDRMEENYETILKKNHLQKDEKMYVPEEFRHYG